MALPQNLNTISGPHLDQPPAIEQANTSEGEIQNQSNDQGFLITAVDAEQQQH